MSVRCCLEGTPDPEGDGPENVGNVDRLIL